MKIRILAVSFCMINSLYSAVIEKVQELQQEAPSFFDALNKETHESDKQQWDFAVDVLTAFELFHVLIPQPAGAAGVLKAKVVPYVAPAIKQTLQQELNTFLSAASRMTRTKEVDTLMIQQQVKSQFSKAAAQKTSTNNTLLNLYKKINIQLKAAYKPVLPTKTIKNPLFGKTKDTETNFVKLAESLEALH